MRILLSYKVSALIKPSRKWDLVTFEQYTPAGMGEDSPGEKEGVTALSQPFSRGVRSEDTESSFGSGAFPTPQYSQEQLHRALLGITFLNLSVVPVIWECSATQSTVPTAAAICVAVLTRSTPLSYSVSTSLIHQAAALLAQCSF